MIFTSEALAADQHLASLVRHGLDTFTDGVQQFSGPATGTSWQRWFQPADPLPHAHGANTGDFIDAFGNKLHVHAVANPTITFAHYRTYHPGRSQGLGDRRLKGEGYGIVCIERAAHDRDRMLAMERRSRRAGRAAVRRMADTRPV